MGVAELTVAKYMRRPSPRPSSTWRTFLEAHIGEIVATDLFVVPTLTFRLLFGFLIVRHEENACQVLAEIQRWFTEGFDTPDLSEARTLPTALRNEAM